MRYSVRGTIPIDDSQPLIATINSYQLWRLITAQEVDEELGEAFTFEAWVNSEDDKTALFDDIKPFVDAHGGWTDWHVCTHDEPTRRPCVIAETYTQGG